MKKAVLFVLPLLLITLCGFGQDGRKNKRDTTRIKMGKSTLIIINDTLKNGEYDHDLSEMRRPRMPRREWASWRMDIGLNGYMAPNHKLSLPHSQRLMEIDYPRSRSFSLIMNMKGANLIKDRLYIMPGLGLTWNSYFFRNNINIAATNDTTAFLADSTLNFSKYKLRATYLEVPLVLGVKIGDLQNPLGLQVGVVGGLKINSMIKQKYTIAGVDYKAKVKDDFNINPFRLDLIARITFRSMGFFARYSLTSLFQDNKAPQLNTFSAGITIGDCRRRPRTRQ